ncbi:MAG TPA: hypothetical protein PLK13_12370 [Xanthobacteraceae bacterium]|jgi:hypothetical protein|nr:hypothetical protein [Xanthobacteraceae bacterium]HQS49960.1 hypothetical protein [Xanthobacteraceae bacterium]
MLFHALTMREARPRRERDRVPAAAGPIDRPRAFSSEVNTGSREKNATTQ